MVKGAEAHPVSLFVQNLRNRYGGLALFFHDELGGNFVAVKWRPRAFLPTPFSTAGVQHCLQITRAASSKAKSSPQSWLLPDVANVLEGMRVAGGALVHRVITNLSTLEETRM